MADPRFPRGLLPQAPQRGAGVLSSVAAQMPQEPGTRKQSVLDRILGLYGADPGTHIPEEQRGTALGRGLFQAGLGAASISGRGHDRPSVGQHLANFMGTMGQTGPAMAQENLSLQRRAKIQQLIESGQMNADQMQAVMMELIGQGDYEGARSIGEVLKTMLAARSSQYIRSPDPIYNTDTGEWIYPDMGEAGGAVKRNVKVAYPQGDPGNIGIAAGEQVSVPQREDGSYVWPLAVDAGESDASKANRYSGNIRSLTKEYEKAVNRVEPSFRLTHAAIGAAGSARAGDGAAQLGLLYGFIRALDPNSVVREGEVRLAQEAAPFRMRMIQLYNDFIANKSPIMAPEMVDMMVEFMTRLEESNVTWLGSQRHHYGTIMANEVLGGPRMDLFRDPLTIMGAGGGNPLGSAGAPLIYSQEDYDRMLERVLTDDATERTAVDEARTVWEEEQ